MSKVFLIIGASSDLGCELIKEIIARESDAVIYAHYRTSKKNIGLIAESKNNKIIPIQADLSDELGCDAIIKKLLSDNAIPYAIVHLPAPKLEYNKFKDINWDDCVKDLNIQVGSAFRILQALIPRMLKNNSQSKIAFTLSENTIKMPAKFSTKYTMSKYMMLGLMKSLVAEYEGKKININAISPTMMNTKFLSEIDARLLEMTGAAEKMISTKRVAPELYKLISEESDNMFGENVYISAVGTDKNE